MPGKATTIRLKVKQVIQETSDTRSFLLETDQEAPIPYTAGQFLTFVFRKRNGEEARRNYSISSAQALNEPLTITVKRIPNGEFSRMLVDNVREGDLLQTIGASGFFTLPERIDSFGQYFFFAAGSGITPVFALIKTLLYRNTKAIVVLVYSNPSEKQAIFYQSILQLRDQFPERFKTEFFFSNANRMGHKRISAFRVAELLQQYAGDQIQSALFYLCGPFEYMRMIGIVLLGNAVPANHIRKEMFNIEKPVTIISRPPDTEAHRVGIRLADQAYAFVTQYPETILQTAKKQGIPLPYSCESGQCGTCAATCVSGKVWMWRNDVLLKEEIEKGRVLTCTGYAIGGDIALVL